MSRCATPGRIRGLGRHLTGDPSLAVVTAGWRSVRRPPWRVTVSGRQGNTASYSGLTIFGGRYVDVNAILPAIAGIGLAALTGFLVNSDRRVRDSQKGSAALAMYANQAHCTNRCRTTAGTPLWARPY